MRKWCSRVKKESTFELSMIVLQLFQNKGNIESADKIVVCMIIA